VSSPIHGLELPAETFWEQASHTRWGGYLTRAERAELVRAASLAGGPGEALEVGAEGGRWSLLLQSAGWAVTCTDVAEQSLEICRRRLPEARCILVDPADVRFPVESGAVRLLIVIEVAPVSEASWFPAESERVLEPGGVLFLGFTNASSPRGAAYRILRSLGRREHREYEGPSFADMKQRLEAHGLEIVSAQGLGWAPFTRLSDNPLIPLATGLERLAGLRRLARFAPLVLLTARKNGGGGI
jgi:SAM-dependent methyltransferase